MNILLGLTDNKDHLLLQAYLVLEQRNVVINKISYIRTAESDSDNEVSNFFKTKGIEFCHIPISKGGKLASEADYAQQEEEIFKWYHSHTSRENKLFLFIGGGNKLHSLAMQKCSVLFGAEEVFHSFYNGLRGSEPISREDIIQAINSQKLLFASLGKETGWPAIQQLLTRSNSLRDDIVTITKSIADRNISDINDLPFESLSLLPPKVIAWLETPLDSIDQNWINLLPKTELHCHLGGFGTHGLILDQIRESASPHSIPDKQNILFPDYWPVPKKPIDLLVYMKLGDNGGSYILNNEGCLKTHISLLYEHLLSQNIRYAEIRCSPYNYVNQHNSGKEVLELIRSSFQKLITKAQIEDPDNVCHVNLIIIATRRFDGDQKALDDHLELAIDAERNSDDFGVCNIVGVDLAGFEHVTTRASYFKENFNRIHRRGIALTIHAGENDDSEGIWQAVFDLNTRRVGHALNLFQDNELLRSIVNRNIGIEMCPYANYQIKGFMPMQDNTKENSFYPIYPLLKYLKAGAKVTVNTDNIGISNANLSDNFLLLAQLNKGITKMQILQLIRNGLDQGFVSHKLRSELLKYFNQKIFDLCFYNK